MNSPYGKGSFLIANGNLLDPNFRRRVVFLCEHNEKGSYGLILNQPTPVYLSELFAGNPILKNSQEKLFCGGPCEPERIQVLHSCDAPDLASFKVCEGIFLGGKFEEVLRMKKESPETMACRFYSGYSGWGEGQLENEMRQKSWIACPANREALFNTHIETMWQSLLQSMGDYFAFVAQMPPDPRVN